MLRSATLRELRDQMKLKTVEERLCQAFVLILTKMAFTNLCCLWLKFLLIVIKMKYFSLKY